MSQPRKITTLFLDIGGVLLTNGWDHNSRAHAVKKFNLNQDEVSDRHHLTFDTYEEGKLSLEQYLNRVIFYEDRSFSKEEFRKFMFSQSKPHEKMLAFIRQLKEKLGLRITAVSNEGREINDHRIKSFKLNEIFDAFISSSFVHLRKPDEDIFRMALDISQVEPKNVAYIDDRKMYIEIASEMGIHGVHHTGIESTRARLKELGVDV